MWTKKNRDRTNEKVGRLLLTEFVGYKLFSGRRKGVWKCLCDCGNTVEIETYRLDGKRVLSCGCLLTDFNTTHGMTGTKEFDAWCEVKRRVTNPNNKYYYIYKDVELSEEFKNDFMAFYKEIGPCPEPKSLYSVDRRNTLLGYIPGNLRWAVAPQQARNTSMHSNNTSGVTGVCLNSKENPCYWVGTARQDGKQVTKLFSIKTLGYEEAFNQACLWRENKITELNTLGYEYSEVHGQPRVSK